MEFILPYKLTVLVMGLSALLFLLQLLIVDVVAIKAKHTPGYAIKDDHNSLLFRSHRALANSNESIGILILLIAFAVLSSVNPTWLNGLAVLYLVARFAHMLFYYLDLKALRSTAFGFSLLALFGMFVTGLLAWL